MSATPATTCASGASRSLCARYVACGVALGFVLGASLAFALTHPMEDAVRILRDRMQGELREPQFELLN